MSFFRPLRPLLLGWLGALLGWGALSFVVSYGVVANTPLTWIEALQAPVRDWLPWTLAGPLLFRFVNRFPLGRERWGPKLGAHLVVFALMVLLARGWSSYLDVRPAPAFERFGGPLEKRFPRFGGPAEDSGPGFRRGPGGVGERPPPGAAGVGGPGLARRGRTRVRGPTSGS